MKILFQTKEESNKQQLEAFLQLSKAERIYNYFEFIIKSKKLPTKAKIQKNNNYIIEIQCKK